METKFNTIPAKLNMKDLLDELKAADANVTGVTYRAEQQIELMRKVDGARVTENSTEAEAIVVFHDGAINSRAVETAISAHAPTKSDEQRATDSDPIEDLKKRVAALEAG